MASSAKHHDAKKQMTWEAARAQTRPIQSLTLYQLDYIGGVFLHFKLHTAPHLANLSVFTTSSSHSLMSLNQISYFRTSSHTTEKAMATHIEVSCPFHCNCEFSQVFDRTSVGTRYSARWVFCFCTNFCLITVVDPKHTCTDASMSGKKGIVL